MKLFIAAGTGEGRELAKFCEEQGIMTVLSVATDYGEELLTPGKNVTVQRGRMDAAEMAVFLKDGSFTQVIDATHPYAVEASSNLRQACEEQKLPYLRLLREQEELQKDCVYVESTEEAAAWLESAKGNILLTTGSKEIQAYAAVTDRSRLYPRVLPDADSLAACENALIPRKNIIGMQGPFLRELNRAMLLQIGAQYLVTKDSGSAGGFQDKIEACLETGATAVIIRRPQEPEGGYSLKQVKEFLVPGWEQLEGPEVFIVGTGPGADRLMTAEAGEAVRRADICIGASRMLESARQQGKETYTAYKGEEIAVYLKEHPSCRKVAVLVSGDTGFYSAAKKLTEALQEYRPRLLPGISSLVYLCSRLGMGWEDVKLCSHHGIRPALTDIIREHQKVFALFGKGREIREVCGQLSAYGMNQVCVHVGENLSYPEERILHGTAEEMLALEIGDLSVALFENAEAIGRGYPYGMADADFIRGKVPMTKEEVRTVSLAKLKLGRDSILYDIGAGTGSVSIEAALACPEGRVYAIEKNPEALELIHKNMEKFKVSNIIPVEGTAPEALHGLIVPTHAFIGGSAGNLKEILGLLFKLNPDIRPVLNAVSLETAGQVTELARQMGYCYEMVTLQVSRSRAAGNYHLMQGENPVMIFCIERGVK